VDPGQSVDTTTPLGIIVSSADRMDVDLQIPNSIARDLHKGQSLRLTIRAYPNARFGTVKGTIMSISRDATRIDPSKTPYREPVIIARVALDWSSNARIPPSSLSAGMEVTATIQTGRASMLHALLKR
jgi:hemolysin D